ncbi:MAG TPA: hypothetical protein VIJ46_03080, partial [Rhabdochlamydiaceae bacterium]
ALTSTFDLQNQSQIFGTISKKFFSLNTVYHFEDPMGEMIAKAESQFFTWGTTVDIHAATGEKIGWIEEQLFTWFSPSKYRVYDGTNRMVAVARMNFWGTTFTVTDPNDNDKEIALVYRPWFQFFKNSWTVQILDPQKIAVGQVDPRLLVMVAVYRTDSENRAAFYRRTSKALDWYLDQNNNHTNVGFLDETQDAELLAMETRIQELTAELRQYSFPEPENKAFTQPLLDKVEAQISKNLKESDAAQLTVEASQLSGEQYYAAQKKAEAAVYVEVLESFSKFLKSDAETSDATKGEMVYFVNQLLQQRRQ